MTTRSVSIGSVVLSWCHFVIKSPDSLRIRALSTTSTSSTPRSAAAAVLSLAQCTCHRWHTRESPLAAFVIYRLYFCVCAFVICNAVRGLTSACMLNSLCAYMTLCMVLFSLSVAFSSLCSSDCLYRCACLRECTHQFVHFWVV